MAAAWAAPTRCVRASSVAASFLFRVPFISWERRTSIESSCRGAANEARYDRDLHEELGVRRIVGQGQHLLEAAVAVELERADATTFRDVCHQKPRFAKARDA